ncbi:MAG: alpha-amylase/4-alpha-glucanotransferase domain-containing protein [Elusimicrobiota bacterium]
MNAGDTIGKVDFIFGLHFHQPVGNFTEILENAYRDAYLPVISTFSRFENIKLNLHISAPLLEFFLSEHPDFLANIKELVKQGRIEMLGGGFYEPILISIPKRDIEGQISMMEDFLDKHLAAKSRGIWLTERVWEPHIPSLLKDTHAEYLAVDDTHFIQAGFPPDSLNGYYMTEDAGNKLGIFIISKELRYSIPFHPVKGIMKQFRRYAQSAHDTLVCMLDDGEKFGVWPNTKEWVYGNNWLEDFFRSLEENSSWLSTHTLSGYFDTHKPAGKAYLPACSYSEMLEWTIPVKGAQYINAVKQTLRDHGLLKETEKYLTGGIWKNYFFKYPESDYMHKKMLYLSNRLDKEAVNFPDKDLLHEAYSYLFRSQCNCSYWHGVFGGIYLSHLRNAVYENLIRLHNVLDTIKHKGQPFISVENKDMDCDGSEEILIDTDKMFASIKPSEGGMIAELSDKDTCFNLLNTVSRKEESYHVRITNKPNGPDQDSAGGSGSAVSIHDIPRSDDPAFKAGLVYDTHLRKCMIDRVFLRDVTLENIMDGNAAEIPVYNSVYVPRLISETGTVSVCLETGIDADPLELGISKKLVFKSGKRGFDATISVTNFSDSETCIRYGAEFNFSMLSDLSPDKTFFLGDQDFSKPLSEAAAESGISFFGINDRDLGIRIDIRMDKEGKVFSFPVRTVTDSESGFELTYQATCMIPVFELELNSGDTFVLNLNFSVKSIKKAD